MNSILQITDGVNTVDLISEDSGFHLNSWQPSLPRVKAGGVWQDSPLVDGRRKVFRRWENVVDVFDLKIDGADMDTVILDLRRLRALLLASDDFWASEFSFTPVFLVARGACEANTRYALVHGWDTPGDDNPFEQPFFSAQPVVDDFVLNIEHGFWLSNPPGERECVSVSGTQSGWYALGTEQLENPGFETAGGGGADVFANWTETAGDGGIASSATVHSGAASCRLTSGATSNTQITQSQSGLTPGTTGYLSFWTRGSGTVDGRYGLYDVTNAAYIRAVGLTGVTGTTFTLITYSFTVPAGCTQVRVEFLCPTTNGQAAYFDDVSLRFSGSARTPGRSGTCTAQVYFGNKRTTGQISDVYVYDASAGTFGTNRVGAALPYALLPAVPAAGDIVYFGVEAAHPEAGRFNNLIVDLSAGGVDVTGVWEIYTSGAWAAVSLGLDETDAAGAETGDPLDTAGVGSVTFDYSLMEVFTINGINAYWLRLRVTAVGGGPTPPTQQNRDPYTATWANVVVDNAQVGGDLPALLEALLTYYDQPSSGSESRIFMGLRSLARGNNFSAYLNSHSPNPTGVAVTLGTATAYNTGAPYYFISPYADYSAAGAEALATRITWTISGSLAIEYTGRFRALLRVGTGVGGDVDSVTFRPVIKAGSSGYSVTGRTVTVHIVETFSQVVDLGTFEFPGSSNMASGETLDTITIAVQAGCTDAGGGSVHFYDLILIPTDEFSVDAIDRSDSGAGFPYGISFGEYMDLDSVTTPKTSLRAAIKATATDAINSYWQPVHTSPAILQVDADQALWFLATYYDADGWKSHSSSLFSIQAYKNQRYLSMRGDT